MAAITGKLGEVLVNSLLPEEYRVSGPMSKNTLSSKLVNYARKNPEDYARSISKIKSLGDEFATYEGVSVGLDDIAPQYESRKPVIAQGSRSFWGAKNDQEKIKALVNTQSKLMGLTKKHPGDMGLIARSGGRGSIAQLMKATAGPVAASGKNGVAVPYLIERGYSEGLSPAEAWVTGDESRSSVISGVLGTAEPGDLGKILASMMSNQVISSADCGTKNGLSFKHDDPSLIGRFRASSGSLIGSGDFSRIKKSKRSVVARSPMTCELPSGVCQKCKGQSPDGTLPDIGVNVGVRSAQALAEPLTQMQLSAKHGVFTAKEEETFGGLKAFRQFTEVPSSFFHKAPLATVGGRVDSIAKAPQGGFDIKIKGRDHYVPPGRNVRISKGQTVEAGDVLSSGIPAPNEIVQYKGLGEGRKYLVSALEGVYKDSGINVDRRHLELMAKSQLNNVKLVDEVPGYLPGEIVPYHELSKTVLEGAEETPTKSAMGRTLSRPTLHHLPGAKITKKMLSEFKEAGVEKVTTSPNAPKFEPHMTSASRTPLLNPNWMQRLGHRYQKATILSAAQFGQKADLHSHNPIPAIVFGKELRRGPGGTY